MIRSAYLTTGLAIKTLHSLLKANVVVHGQENIPDRPNIFVINHFTRMETFILPYHIFNLTGIPVWSLADANIFHSGFGKFLEMVGAVSTKDPQRDELIMKSLLTGEANWVIFPEGTMVKTKKIIHSGQYMISDHRGLHEPFTGAATLALRTELFRRYMLLHTKNKTKQAICSLEYLDLNSIEEIRDKSPAIVPVNLTYYPIRARENIASVLTEKLIKGVPERVLEELMTEGTMLFQGVDLDIRFGPAITLDDILDREVTEDELLKNSFSQMIVSTAFNTMLQEKGSELMQRYMHAIYSMTTVNQEHLLASYLRLYPYRRIHIQDLLRRVYFASLLLKENVHDLFLHKSLQEDQSHLLIDDRYGKVDNFLQLAISKGIVKREDDILIRDNQKLSVPISFHRSRIDNPVEVIANEVEPLDKLQKLILSLAWQPDFLLKILLANYLFRMDKKLYRQAKHICCSNEAQTVDAKPLLFPSIKRKVGVLLIHSYLAGPKEVEPLGRFLNRQGYWVYALRLPGHGTCVHDLAKTDYGKWIESVNRGYIMLSNLCEKIVIGGVAAGGSLALHLASSTNAPAGVFSLSSPFKLNDYSTKFMPTADIWSQIMQRLKHKKNQDQFLPYQASSPQHNYPKNPVAGIKEIDNLLAELRNNIEKITIPVLLMHGERDKVVGAQSSKTIFKKIAAENKELDLIDSDNHVLLQGQEQEKTFERILNFIQNTVQIPKETVGFGRATFKKILSQPVAEK